MHVAATYQLINIILCFSLADDDDVELPSPSIICDLLHAVTTALFLLFSFWQKTHTCLKKGKSPVYTLQLSKKSDFQFLTIKPDNIGHPTIKTGQIWPLGGFEGGFVVEGWKSNYCDSSRMKIGFFSKKKRNNERRCCWWRRHGKIENQVQHEMGPESYLII